MRKFGILVLLMMVWGMFFGVGKVQARPICDGPGMTCLPGDPCNSSICGSIPADHCCVPGSGDPYCAGKSIWTWAYNPSCIVDRVSNYDLNCSWHWSYTECSAVDSCRTQTGLRPGYCATGGCQVGPSLYKTCCNFSGGLDMCNGGDYSGTCPNKTVFGSGIASDCSPVATPTLPPGVTPTSPPASGCNSNWGHTCSEWNNNAAGCWSNGQFSGQPSCSYCSNTNTCVCGGCPPVNPCPAGQIQCTNGGTCCRDSSLYNTSNCSCSDAACRAPGDCFSGSSCPAGYLPWHASGDPQSLADDNCTARKGTTASCCAPAAAFSCTDTNTTINPYLVFDRSNPDRFDVDAGAGAGSCDSNETWRSYTNIYNYDPDLNMPGTLGGGMCETGNSTCSSPSGDGFGARGAVGQPQEFDWLKWSLAQGDPGNPFFVRVWGKCRCSDGGGSCGTGGCCNSGAPPVYCDLAWHCPTTTAQIYPSNVINRAINPTFVMKFTYNRDITDLEMFNIHDISNNGDVLKSYLGSYYGRPINLGSLVNPTTPDCTSTMSIYGTLVTITWTCKTPPNGNYIYLMSDKQNCESRVSFKVMTPAPPVISGFQISNKTSVDVAAEAGSRNQICQSEFLGSRSVVLKVTASDADGAANIKEIRTRFTNNGTTYLEAYAQNLQTASIAPGIAGAGLSFWAPVTKTISGNSVTVNFPITFQNDFPMASSPLGTFNYQGKVFDTYGVDSGWVDSGRDMKVWNCNVDTVGNIFEDTTGLGTCSNTPATSALNFAAIGYTGFAMTGAANKSMTVTVPDKYASGSNPLVWGKSYMIYMNADINGKNSGMKTTDVGTGMAGVCSPMSGSISLTSNVISAYSDNPGLRADFTYVRNQDPWFRVSESGIRAQSSISDSVPTTCASQPICGVAAMAFSKTSQCCLVAAPSIANNGLSFSWPTNWYYNGSVLSAKDSYQTLLNKYTAMGIGYTYITDTSISAINANPVINGKGIIFVSGTLTVDVNTNVAPTDYLMVIVKNNIVINNTVTQFDGIMAADGSITATGDGDQLVINGMVHSFAGTVKFSRNFTNHADNNTKPPVVVNYNPGLIFMLPGKITRSLYGWRQGN